MEHNVVPAQSDSHRAPKRKRTYQTTVPATQVHIFQVNPKVWRTAVAEARKHGVKAADITIISKTKVEFVAIP